MADKAPNEADAPQDVPEDERAGSQDDSADEEGQGTCSPSCLLSPVQF